MSDNDQTPFDLMTIQHLGAAVLLCWGELSMATQELILDRANDTVGMVPVREVRDQIADLLRRRARLVSSSPRSHEQQTQTTPARR